MYFVYLAVIAKKAVEACFSKKKISKLSIKFFSTFQSVVLCRNVHIQAVPLPSLLHSVSFIEFSSYFVKFYLFRRKRLFIHSLLIITRQGPEATVTHSLVWKWGVYKRGILKSLISHVLIFKSWIKLIYDKITYIYCIINEFNPTFEVQNMENEAFQNASFWNALFQMGTRVTVASGPSRVCDYKKMNVPIT